jgi:hypothetical protein
MAVKRRMLDVKKFPVHTPKKGDKRGFSKWIQPRMSGYLISCCDCGFTHQMQFRIVDGNVQYRCRIARNYTKAMREAFTHHCELK